MGPRHFSEQRGYATSSTKIMRASLFRRDSEYPNTLISIGSPAGAARTKVNIAPAISPSCIMRCDNGFDSANPTTLARWPGLRSASVRSCADAGGDFRLLRWDKVPRSRTPRYDPRALCSLPNAFPPKRPRWGPHGAKPRSAPQGVFRGQRVGRLAPRIETGPSPQLQRHRRQGFLGSYVHFRFEYGTYCIIDDNDVDSHLHLPMRFAFFTDWIR